MFDPPKPRNNFPREIIGRAVRDDGFREYLLNHPEECLTEAGYGEHKDFGDMVAKVKSLGGQAKFGPAFEAFRSKVTSTGGPD
jgi:hypothetical protein